MNMDKIGSRKVVIVLEIKDYLFLSTKNKKSVWAVHWTCLCCSSKYYNKTKY